MNRPPITRKDKPWLVQDANAGAKRLQPIGSAPEPGLSPEDVQTRLLLNSEQHKAEMQALTTMVEQLLVTTQALLDALAEEQDPDAPVTCMDGTPI